MKSRRGALALAVALVVAVLTLAACGGADEETTTTATTSAAPSAGAPPSSSLGALPPGFVECMADRGYEITSPEDIHAAPPAVLQACFAH